MVSVVEELSSEEFRHVVQTEDGLLNLYDLKIG